MNISAISGINQIESLINDQNTTSQSSGSASAFKDIYNSLIGNVNSTDKAFNGDIVKSAEGELDNPHQLSIDATKANIALQLVSSVRTDALSAYNDITKMSV